MDGAQSFAQRAVERLQPVLAPRGLPVQPSGVQDESVLFHCDGPQLDEVIDRYPGWRERLIASYDPQPIVCLDLWVQRSDGRMSWSFEAFDHDVTEAAGPQAVGRLEQLATGPAEPWLDQLAEVLDAYFATLETS